LALLRALAKKRGPIGLVHFDAHVDTWKENFGQKYGHGSVFFHAIEEELVDPRRMIQIGIRSPVQKDVFDWTLSKGVTIVTAEDAHMRTPKEIAETIRAVVGEQATYLSFDIDALDPAFAPALGRRKSAASRPGRPRRFCGGSKISTSSAWTSWKSRRSMIRPKSPRWRRPPLFGNISRSSRYRNDRHSGVRRWQHDDARCCHGLTAPKESRTK
jgi:hypothetical protein